MHFTDEYKDVSDNKNEEPYEIKNSGKRRKYHNILESKRRNHIKDGYHKLRDTIPSIYGKKISRIQILKKAIECIRTHEEEILRHENHLRIMREKSESLKKTLDFIKTKDFSVR